MPFAKIIGRFLSLSKVWLFCNSRTGEWLHPLHSEDPAGPGDLPKAEMPKKER